MSTIRTFLAQRFKYTRELEESVIDLWDELMRAAKERGDLGAQLMRTEFAVFKVRALLPDGRNPQTPIETLEAFTDAVEDIGTLMGAIIDYRNLLIRADVPDIPALQNDGVTAIFDKYGFDLKRVKKPVGEMWAATNQNMTELAAEATEAKSGRG